METYYVKSESTPLLLSSVGKPGAKRESKIEFRVHFDCCVISTCVNKIEAMYERLLVNVNVEQGSTFTFTIFYYACKIYLRAHVKIQTVVLLIDMQKCHLVLVVRPSSQAEGFRNFSLTQFSSQFVATSALCVLVTLVHKNTRR